MSEIFSAMATTRRHNKIAMTFSGTVLELQRKKEVNALQEECALVYWGDKKCPDNIELVDVKNIGDLEHFTDIIINELHYIEPDFVLFKDNLYLENKRQTRTAGQPDLVVEIWSKSNSQYDRAFLQNLYATSEITEHWYIEQDSNDVICWIGKNRLEEQHLSNVLLSRGGLEFDLRYLAI